MFTTRPVPALAIAALCALAPAADAAGEVPADVVRGEVLSGWVTASGTRMSALRLTLAPGWKTYWRAPGDTGIPPNFSWAGSDNLKAVVYHWPSPEVFDSYGLRTIGYKHELILPIELHPSDPTAPIRLRGAMDLGVCETICVPAHLSFEAELSGKGASDMAIHAALAERPVSAQRAGVSEVDCDIAPISDGLKIEATIRMPRLTGGEVAVVETNDPRIWVSEPQTERNGDDLRVLAELVPPSGMPVALDRSALRFTVIGAHSAVDIRGCTTR
ncbi:protein-disulfide reductase DsbD domain-containing protein [Tropicimonas aquimaris]|uniref:Protein-disulfide reductase DsbD domain-containing protein n=1 Tax=Tropicimonas aquimaris TaxID=914152 RepID=A0ABW3IVW8_9RHOB